MDPAGISICQGTERIKRLVTETVFAQNCMWNNESLDTFVLNVEAEMIFLRRHTCT